MATDNILVPFDEGTDDVGKSVDVAVQHSWRRRLRLSSIGDRFERGLNRSGFDKGPWLAVSFAIGIAAWFVLDAPWQWASLIGGCGLASLAAIAIWKGNAHRVGVHNAIFGAAVTIALGVTTIWVRSEIVGADAIERPSVGVITAKILERDEQPAEGRVRLVLATRDFLNGTAQKIRVNVPAENAGSGLTEGALIRLRARLMPPSSSMLPGGYDFARTAWFKGYAATGSAIGEIELVEASHRTDDLAESQRRLSSHVRSQLDGSAGSIAAALASGDRGGINDADEEAMRDAGLTHLLSISGLHVSAVIAAAYLLSIKALALWPWLALRVRLPLVAATFAASAGIGYTLLTGAEVPTVRSCVGAILVLIALALGREALSMRMVATAAMFVLLLWPESLIGPSFQMSFAAVLAIVALHNSAPVRTFLAPREESWFSRLTRRTFMLLITGFVIELALMPIVLFHFHRAGVYGAFANVIGIPLTTFLSMPLIALSLLLDVIGLGAPVWYLAGKSLDLLLGIAHFTAEQPGAVKLMPEMGSSIFALFVGGGLWMALWRGRKRLFGLGLSGIAAVLLLNKPVPDIFVSGDGKHVGVASEGERLLVLRESRSSYAKENLLELAGMDGEPIALVDWPGADCNRDFCVLQLQRGGRSWSVLMAKSRDRVEERALAAACERSDIVIADRWLPRSCQPKWLKADRNLLDKTGGLAINLAEQEFTTVAQSQGEHGWWRGKGD